MIDYFTFYRSYYEIGKRLSRAEKVKYYEMIFDYVFEDTEPQDNNDIVYLLFLSIKPTLDKSKQLSQRPFVDYEEYIKSPKWKEKRLLKAKEQNYTCEKCNKVLYVGFNIHHLTYERLGNEDLSDLQFLCEDCHKRIHHIPKVKTKKKTKNNKNKVVSKK